VHLADVQDLARFPVRELDLVVSQVVLAHVARKDRALEESARLLAPDGVFLHEIDHLEAESPDFTEADLPRFAIYEQGARISTRTYLERHGIETRIGKAAGPEVVLAIFHKGAGELNLGLHFDGRSTIVLKSLVTSDPEARPWGVRSVYRTPREQPRG
jgi:SAM-dependent methyltransferase